ncbi:MAG: DUF721 domain-containing protein [Gammaproteobacteria bacterium]|nr:MAG: DUF721 domain-containing protein [Gammaproteobacteria bacterium]
MSTNDPKSLSELIAKPGSKLDRLARLARSKLQLTEHIRNGLPAELAAQMIHCSIDDDQTLIVRASTPEWATRLRFETECLLRLSRARAPETRSVKVRVAHPADAH